jgi:hypothetical protein
MVANAGARSGSGRGMKAIVARASRQEGCISTVNRMAGMALRFPAYRRYREARITSNDAMVALVIASRLGQHVLRTSAADPDALLPVLFRKLPGVERLNVTAERAAELLESSEQLLAQMAIPYVLSVHEAYLGDAIEMIKDDGKDPKARAWTVAWAAGAEAIPLADKHAYIAERTGVAMPERELELFELFRLIRNRSIHYAGRAGSRVPTVYRHMSQDAKQRWVRVAGRALNVEPETDLISLGDGDLKLVLATAFSLGVAVNESLAVALSREYWASLVVADFHAGHQSRRNDPQLARRVVGFARREYGRLALSEDEIRKAVESS